MVYICFMLLTLLEPQSRFGDKPLQFQVVCPQNGTAVLKGLTAQIESNSPINCACSTNRRRYQGILIIPAYRTLRHFMCVFFVISPGDIQLASVRADSSIIETQALGSQSYTQRYYVDVYLVCSTAVQRTAAVVGNARSCHHTGYGNHDIHIL